MSTEVRRLLAFGALAAFCAHHWFLLVESSDEWRWVVCVVAGLAGALVLVGLRSQRRTVAIGGAVLVFAAMLAEGLVAIGIPAELLLPGNWGELRAQLDRGLAGVSEIDTPYAGADAWTRLGVLAAVPLMVALGMTAVFWPLGSQRARTMIGIGFLLALYGTSVTWEAPSAELARGAGLFALVAAVLWLPRVELPRLAPALAAVVLALAVAFPLASRVDASDPLVGYAGWRVFGDEEEISFNWNHTYGKLDWPQEGTEVFVATTAKPAYWKTFVLDTFDGAAWSRAIEDFGETGADSDLAGASDELIGSNSEWVRQFEIRLTTLRTRLAVTSGTPLEVEGIDVGEFSGDGTTPVERFEVPLGSEYSVTSYVPEPTRGELRRASGAHPVEAQRYTTLGIPRAITREEKERDLIPPIGSAVVPPRGVVASKAEKLLPEPPESIDEVVEGTPYERILRLTRRVTDGARTDYEAVSRVQGFLLSNYTYDQDVPLADDPISEFLLRERAGYCQQFSGAMALMLRMAGIPSRVVSGFAPGERQDGGDYSVTDQDAHSWVEVLYPGIGWVTVDPTPAETPARTDAAPGTAVPAPARLDDLDLGSVLRNRGGGERGFGEPTQGEKSRAEDDGASPIPFLAFLGLAGGAGAIVSRRRRRMRSPRGAELQLRELHDALAAAGLAAGSGATLLAIQHRLSAWAGPDAARYVAALSDSRYGARRRKRPGPAERRAFRWALARNAGIWRWWKTLRAVPPGGPRG
jgi:protein-glutamine gamma-glutamyltransferase